MSRVNPIDPATVLRARDTMKLVDVREPHELVGELAILDGAESVPLASLPAAAQGWRRDTPIVVICRSGGRSRRAAEALVALGFTRVHDMVGGMLALRAIRP